MLTESADIRLDLAHAETEQVADSVVMALRDLAIA
jgi:hypothetical protein